MRFFTQYRDRPINIWTRLHRVHGVQTMSQQTVRFWHHRFSQDGNASVLDLPRPGAPHHGRSPWIIRQNNHFTIRQMSAILHVSSGTLSNILHKDLNLIKLCTWYVPKVLTPTQKAAWLQACRRNLAWLQTEPLLLHHIVSGDESWVFTFDLEMKQRSQAWLSRDDPRPQKGLRSWSQRKYMLVAFMDRVGCVHHEFVQRTVNHFVYTRVLGRLRESVCRWCPGLWMEGSGHTHTPWSSTMTMRLCIPLHTQWQGSWKQKSTTWNTRRTALTWPLAIFFYSHASKDTFEVASSGIWRSCKGLWQGSYCTQSLQRTTTMPWCQWGIIGRSASMPRVAISKGAGTHAHPEIQWSHLQSSTLELTWALIDWQHFPFELAWTVAELGVLHVQLTQLLVCDFALFFARLYCTCVLCSWSPCCIERNSMLMGHLQLLCRWPVCVWSICSNLGSFDLIRLTVNTLTAWLGSIFYCNTVLVWCKLVQITYFCRRKILAESPSYNTKIIT